MAFKEWEQMSYTSFNFFIKVSGAEELFLIQKEIALDSN